jgi:Tol biopolymer transport system component
MGMHAAPSGPWVAMELACVGGEASVVQILYIANVQDNTVQAATSFANTLVEAPVWSLDGAQLAFAAMPSGGGVSDVWLYAPNTNVVTRVTQDADTRYPVFTSDR